MEYNRNSPTTSGGNTPSIPIGAEGNFAGMNPQMAGMGGMPTMTPQMFYNMYTWMSQMGQMMPGAAGMPANMSGMGGIVGMGGMPPNMAGVGGMVPGAVGMSGTPPNMSVSGSMQHRSPRTPGESVYRPYIDLLADDSPSSVPETQYAGIETFSFEDLGLSPIRETPQEEAGPARGRRKSKATARSGGRGKGKVPSSSSHTGAKEEEGEDETERMTIWTV